jgi:hypothetical protein
MDFFERFKKRGGFFSSLLGNPSHFFQMFIFYKSFSSPYSFMFLVPSFFL